MPAYVHFLQTGFDLLMQIFGELFFRQTIDHFIEETAGNQPLGRQVVNSPTFQVEQFLGLYLSGSRSVGTTHIIR
jgi:hypothetical protein